MFGNCFVPFIVCDLKMAIIENKTETGKKITKRKKNYDLMERMI